MFLDDTSDSSVILNTVLDSGTVLVGRFSRGQKALIGRSPGVPVGGFDAPPVSFRFADQV